MLFNRFSLRISSINLKTVIVRIQRGQFRFFLFPFRELNLRGLLKRGKEILSQTFFGGRDVFCKTPRSVQILLQLFQLLNECRRFFTKFRPDIRQIFNGDFRKNIYRPRQNRLRSLLEIVIQTRRPHGVDSLFLRLAFSGRFKKKPNR